MRGAKTNGPHLEPSLKFEVQFEIGPR